MKTYNVYYINLDKSIERKAFMENQFEKLDIPITRISATYGKELDKEFLKKENIEVDTLQVEIKNEEEDTKWDKRKKYDKIFDTLKLAIKLGVVK